MYYILIYYCNASLFQALRRPADPTPGGGSGWPAPIDSTARHSPASTATEATEAPEAPVYDNIQLYALPAAHVEAARALGRLWCVDMKYTVYPYFYSSTAV